MISIWNTIQKHKTDFDDTASLHLTLFQQSFVKQLKQNDFD